MPATLIKSVTKTLYYKTDKKTDYKNKKDKQKKNHDNNIKIVSPSNATRDVNPVIHPNV